MDITPYVESLRRDLLAAAEAAGPEARDTTERLSYALAPSARLALMEAISQAAAEITAELPAGSVDVRLNGRELEFGVHLPPPAEATASAPADVEAEEVDEGNLARITLRIPESVKARAEEYAARSGNSLNTWLVNVVRAATRTEAINIDLDLSSINASINSALGDRRDRGGRRMTGWI
jgi:antitoxin component of RelBE/YafQ-DinJ toxin-antitoxin module